MEIVAGLDVHHAQITFDWTDLTTGECARGRIAPANREEVRRWLANFAGRDAHFALEGTTGWRYNGLAREPPPRAVGSTRLLGSDSGGSAFTDPSP